MTLSLSVSFNNSNFYGNRIIYAAARDVNEGNNTGWVAMGTSTIY